MGNSGLKQHYETAKKTGVITLSNCKLQEFPAPLRQLTSNLRSLDISNNKFQCLPDTIDQYSTLKHINFSNNKIKSIPDSISLLIKLETLNGSSNLLVSIPDTLSKLKNLKQVFLSDNQLKEFPLVFCGLKHLDSLDISKNHITVIPDGVEHLYAIELNANQNQISCLSTSIAKTPRLKTLRLEENCLPIGEIHEAILKDSEISNIVLDGNLFESKQFMSIDGYDEYMKRYTAVKKKMF